MSAAALTASTDSCLIRATSHPLPLAERLCEGEREAIGHPGNVVDRVVQGVAAFDHVVEHPADHVAGAPVLRLDLWAEVDPLEHERAQAHHRLADLVRLPDVTGPLRRLD